MMTKYSFEFHNYFNCLKLILIYTKLYYQVKPVILVLCGFLFLLFVLSIFILARAYTHIRRVYSHNLSCNYINIPIHKKIVPLNVCNLNNLRYHFNSNEKLSMMSVVSLLLDI